MSDQLVLVPIQLLWLICFRFKATTSERNFWYNHLLSDRSFALPDPYNFNLNLFPSPGFESEVESNLMDQHDFQFATLEGIA